MLEHVNLYLSKFPRPKLPQESDLTWDSENSTTERHTPCVFGHYSSIFASLSLYGVFAVELIKVALFHESAAQCFTEQRVPVHRVDMVLRQGVKSAPDQSSANMAKGGSSIEA